MSIWAGIKHAINSTLGTAGFLSLDKIVENNTSVKIQQKTTTLTHKGGRSGSATVTIEEVDTTKSFVVITSYVHGHEYRSSGYAQTDVWLTSLSAALISGTKVELTWTADGTFAQSDSTINVTVAVITFGANVSQS